MVSSTTSGSNAGTMTFVAPTHGSTRATYTPAAWNIGAIVEVAVVVEQRLAELDVHGVGHQVAVGEHHALRACPVVPPV